MPPIEVQANEFIRNSQVLAACQNLSTQLEVTPTLSGRGQGCKQQLSAKQNHLVVCRVEGVFAATWGRICEEARTLTHSLQPSALLPSIYSKFSLFILTVTIWLLLMIYTAYPSLTDGKDTHDNFLPSTLTPRRFPNNFTKYGLLVKLLMKQALINIRGVLRIHS